MTNIIGFYENYMLVQRDITYYVILREQRKILFKGTREEANKIFVMLIAKFINENLQVET